MRVFRDEDFSFEDKALVCIDGACIDDLLGFYCAVGEAVNGPGGYFGASFHAFDDCLFGGFGLGSPATLEWRDAAVSRAALGSDVLLRWLDDECRDPLTDEGAAWCETTRRDALAGRRTMFDELVDCIRSVEDRSSGQRRITLRLL